GPRNPSRSKKRLLKTALRDNYLEKRRPPGCTKAGMAAASIWAPTASAELIFILVRQGISYRFVIWIKIDGIGTSVLSVLTFILRYS
ncbi:hypothetical protein ACET82_16320, partial [Aeromonas veronii]